MATVAVVSVDGGGERALTAKTVRVEDLGKNGPRSKTVSDIVRG